MMEIIKNCFTWLWDKICNFFIAILQFYLDLLSQFLGYVYDFAEYLLEYLKWFCNELFIYVGDWVNEIVISKLSAYTYELLSTDFAQGYANINAFVPLDVILTEVTAIIGFAAVLFIVRITYKIIISIIP